jgi:hypothetical protein
MGSIGVRFSARIPRIIYNKNNSLAPKRDEVLLNANQPG